MSTVYRSRREAALEGRSGGAARLLGGAALFLAVGVGAWFLLTTPGADEGGADTSRSAEMQDAERRTGVDTRMPASSDAPEPVANAGPAVMRPDPPAESADGGEPYRLRIAELEREIAALRARQGDDPDLETLLLQERESMRAQFELERAQAEETWRLQLADITRSLSSGDPGADEAEREARRRLEEERQRRAAIAEAQIMSDGIVLDASGARTASALARSGRRRGGVGPSADGERGLHGGGRRAEPRDRARHEDRGPGPDHRAGHDAGSRAGNGDQHRAARDHPGRRDR